MKILMVLESDFPPDVRVENEILALSEAGHEIHLACSTRKNSASKEIWGNAVIHRKSMSPFIYKSSVGCLKFPFYFNFWRKFISELFSEEKFDAIHIHDLPLAVIGSEVKNKYKTLLVIDLHENWPALIKTAAHTRTILGRLLSSNRQWVNYEKRVLAEADMVVTIIDEARERIIKLGIDSAKVCMVSNTVNYENLNIKPSQNRSDSFIIFYGGAINKHRGLQVVLEAIKICTAKKCKVSLWIVGDGSYRKELEKTAASSGIESHVRFFGHKPFNEMLDLLAQADAAIIPHIRTDNNDASSPNKLYQYMYLNKPIISSDCTSLKRIINETNTGFIYPNNSPEDLSELIIRLYDTPALLAEIKGNGSKAVIEKYNWKTDKQRLTAAYRLLSHENK